MGLIELDHRWSGARRRGLGALAAAVVALTLAAYGGSLSNGFVWDDETLVTANPAVHGLSRWSEFLDPATGATDPLARKTWRPLQTLSFAVEWSAGSGRAAAFHATSLALHAATAVAVAWFLVPVLPPAAAAFGGLLFAVHPALSEGVLSIASRGNQLSTFFCLLSAGLFLRARRPWGPRHAGAALAALLALLSKEQSIALLALLPGLQAAFGRPWDLRSRRSVGLHLPFLAVGAAYLAARWALVGSVRVAPWWGGSPLSTAAMQAKVFLTYLRLVLLPVPLSGRYPAPRLGPGFDAGLAAALAVLAGLLLLALFAWRREPAGRLFGASVAWFFVALAPVSNLVPIPGSMLGERFLYLPLAGALPLALGAALSLRPRPGWAARGAGALVLAACALYDARRVAAWRDDGAFFADVLLRNPADPVVRLRAAQAELDAGDAVSALRRLEPLARLPLAEPDASRVRFVLGRALLAAGRADEAWAAFSLCRVPGNGVDAGLAVLLAESAALSGRRDKALDVLSEALASHPSETALWNALGNVRSMGGETAAAREAWERAVALDPGNREAAANLATLRAPGGTAPGAAPGLTSRGR